jgi:hypothetical protein
MLIEKICPLKFKADRMNRLNKTLSYTRYFWGSVGVAVGGWSAIHMVHTYAPRPLPLPCVLLKRQRIRDLCATPEWDAFLHTSGATTVPPVDVQETVNVLKNIPSFGSAAPAVIFYGPPLSGKTYCLRKCIEQLRNEGHPVVDIGAWAPNAHSFFNIPSNHCLKDYLPEGTILIVDTADLVSSDTPDYFERLVREAHESNGHFHVLLVMADPDKTQKWLDETRQYPVQPVMHAHELRWGKPYVKEFMDNSPLCSQNSQAKEMAERVGTPGFVEMLQRKGKRFMELGPTAQTLEQWWDRYEDVDKTSRVTIKDKLCQKRSE